MQRKERSALSGLEDHIASLQSELVAIAFWDHEYVKAPHHSSIDEVAFLVRRLRVKEIVFELERLKRSLPPQASYPEQSPPPTSACGPDCARQGECHTLVGHQAGRLSLAPI